MQWASHMVNEAKDRSKTLIQRVIRLPNPVVGSADNFEAITKDLETWTETNINATHYNATILEGLDVPRWRETKDLKHKTVLESVNLATLVNPGEALPGGSTDIQTTVWYGRTMSTQNRTLGANQFDQRYSVRSRRLLVRSNGPSRGER